MICSTLYVLDRNSLLCALQISSSSMCFVFKFIMFFIVFCYTEILNFDDIKLSNFSFRFCTYILFKKALPSVYFLLVVLKFFYFLVFFSMWNSFSFYGCNFNFFPMGRVGNRSKTICQIVQPFLNWFVIYQTVLYP